MDSLEKITKREMTVCPKCGDSVAKHNIERHLKRIHSLERELTSVADRNFKIVTAAQQIFMSTVVECTKCKRNIKLIEIKQHFAMAHQSAASQDMLALVGLTEPQNRFKSAREREAYWLAKSGFEGSSSGDIFDNKRVISGGAYGLGKNRKH